MESADYLDLFHPPPRATTDCPENPARRCRILLDGEVVGEGRWPRIIGSIDLAAGAQLRPVPGPAPGPPSNVARGSPPFIDGSGVPLASSSIGSSSP